jgi:ketosteroid isomerase-like protein
LERAGRRIARNVDREGGIAVAHPNEELMRKGYDAFSKGDMDTIRDLFSPDIVWHAPGRNPLSGDHRGIDAVLDTFAKVFEMTGGTFRLDIHDVLADDEHAVVLVRAMAERNGKKLDDRSVQVWHITDGKATEQWLHPGDVYANDEFWND